MGGQCHSTLGNACYPKRAEALDVRIVCLHFLMQLVPGFIPAFAGATLRAIARVKDRRTHIHCKSRRLRLESRACAAPRASGAPRAQAHFPHGGCWGVRSPPRP